MSKIPFSISDRSLTFYVEGNPFSIDRTSPAWDELKDLIQADDPDTDRLIRLTNPVQAVVSAVARVEEADYLPKGVVSVTRNSVKYNGEAISGVLVDRIFDMLSEGFDIMPMVRFLENLYQNPADFARDELYLWLAASDLPITEDGHFLAYKRVNNNYTSVHDGRTDNTPGKVVSMPRQAVDKDRNNTCSSGLHFCSKSYLPHFSGAKIVLLKINPADVVSIPSDYSNAKGRAWKYEVLGDVDFDIPTKTWGAVYVPDAEDDDAEEYLTFPSDLAGALFAALTEIGVDVSDRDERIDWVNDNFGFAIGSFKELTLDEAGDILEYAREVKAEQDADSEATVEAMKVDAYKAEIEAIKGYGIITLRQKASAAGMPGAWKGPNKAALQAYLIARV